jgi:hypothetical protein
MYRQSAEYDIRFVLLKSIGETREEKQQANTHTHTHTKVKPFDFLVSLDW